MHKSVVIVDDFLSNAEQLRSVAGRMEYPQSDSAYPGRNSSQRLRIDGLDQQVSQLVGEHLAALEDGTGHAKFRLTLADDVGKGDIHIDTAVTWSGILYLTAPDHCQGGTDFFRHKETGTDRSPLNAEELGAMGYATGQEMIDDMVGRQGTDRSRWEHTMRVPMRFNRLLLIRPWLWHTAGPGFGSSFEDGRLVYLMFFRNTG